MMLKSFSLFLLIGFHTLTSYAQDSPITVDWSVLTQVEWILTPYTMDANFSDEIKELHGKEVIIEGFMFPLEYTRYHDMFLLSQSPMSACYFCGPGEAESMIFIEASEPVEYTFRPFKMQGRFLLSDDVEMGILYELHDARRVR